MNTDKISQRLVAMAIEILRMADRLEASQPKPKVPPDVMAMVDRKVRQGICLGCGLRYRGPRATVEGPEGYGLCKSCYGKTVYLIKKGETTHIALAEAGRRTPEKQYTPGEQSERERADEILDEVRRKSEDKRKKK